MTIALPLPSSLVQKLVTWFRSVIVRVLMRLNPTPDHRESMDLERLKLIEEDGKELVEQKLDGIASSIETYEGNWDDQGKTYTTVFIVEVPYTFIDDECDYDS